MTNGNGIVCMVDHGRPVISSLSADVVWPVWVSRADWSNSRLVRDLFPSQSQQDVFNEPQCV